MASWIAHDVPFGEYLRRVRKAVSLSQRAAAEQMAINFTYLSKIETGQLPAPSVEVLEKMAIAYGVSRLELFLRAKRLPPEWETQLFDPLTFYEVAKLIHNLNLPRQIKPLTFYDTAPEVK